MDAAASQTSVAGLLLFDADDADVDPFVFDFCCVLYHANISVEKASPRESVSLCPESGGWGNFFMGAGGGGGGGNVPLAGD